MKITLAVMISLLFVSSLSAQAVPAAEIFGGFAFSHDSSINKNLMGWAGSVTGNFNSWFGATVGAQGGYSTLQISGTDIDLSSHSFVGGPRFSARKNPQAVPFAEFLVGAGHATASVAGIGASGNEFLMTGRGGVTSWIKPSVGLQFAANYTRGFSDGESSGAFGFQLGVAFAIGKR